MKYFDAINQTKFFVAALEQHQGTKQILPFIQGAGAVFLDALGDTEKPKIKAVILSSTKSMIRMGLYTLDQGRRPGRKREVPNTRKVGGLVVDESEAPARGLFECCLDLHKDLPPLPAFSAPIRQIIRTDGKIWQALVRSKDADPFAVAEEYSLPVFGHGFEWAMPKQGGSLFDVPQKLYGFIEFLRRAMLPVDDPGVFIRKIASYGRELVYWLMAAEDMPRLERFVYDFCPNHGLRIGTLAPELQAAKILAYCITLDAGITMFSPAGTQSPANAMQQPREDWVAIAQCIDHDAPADIVRRTKKEWRATKYLYFTGKNKNYPFFPDSFDTGVRGFCSKLWDELSGNDAEVDSFSQETMTLDRTWAGDVLAAVSDEWLRRKSRVTIVNVGSGVGNCATKAMATMAKTIDAIALYAVEPDPVACQATLLRLFACRRSLEDYSREITFHSDLDEQAALEALPVSTTPVVMLCDSVPSFPSRAKATGDEFIKRIGSVFAVMEKYGQSVISIRVSADFLDGKEYLGLRQRLFASARTIWVHYDETQKRPKDKRLTQAFATIILDAVGGDVVTPPEGYRKVAAKSELQYSLMPPRWTSGYLSWPALTDLAAVPPLNGPIERRGMTLIDVDADALAARVRDYLSPGVSDERIAEAYPIMMKNAGRFKATLSRQKLIEKTAFIQAYLTPYPFRPFDERFAYLREMRPLFSDPAVDLQVIASIPNNWFLLASEGDAGIGDGVAAWSSAYPCDYDYFAGRSRHFPVWIPDAILNGSPLRTNHGGWEHSEELHPKANLSEDARLLLERLGCPNPNEDTDSAGLLWEFCLAVMYTPAYGKENQAALRLGWPRVPLPGWGDKDIPHEALHIIEEYAAHGKKIRAILSGAELGYHGILSNMATIYRYGESEPSDPACLSDEQRTMSEDWGVPAKGNAVRMRYGALTIKHTEGALQRRILELAEAMELPGAECLDRLGRSCADGRINKEVRWVDIPGATWDFSIGGRNVLRKWLSYRDYRVIKRPLTPMEMNQFSDIARRLVILTLFGIRLDQLWAKLLKTCES